MAKAPIHGRLNMPITNAFAITTSDAADLAQETRGIYVGTAGNIKVTTSNGDTVTLPNLAAGIWHPLSVKKVFATGTTAIDIVGGY